MKVDSKPSVASARAARGADAKNDAQEAKGSGDVTVLQEVREARLNSVSPTEKRSGNDSPLSQENVALSISEAKSRGMEQHINRLESLRDAVRSGRYRPDADQIVDGLLAQARAEEMLRRLMR